MKSKKKLLLMGVGVMGALAMGVGATSTFAWYTATTAAGLKSSTVSGPTVTVENPSYTATAVELPLKIVVTRTDAKYDADETEEGTNNVFKTIELAHYYTSAIASGPGTNGVSANTLARAYWNDNHTYLKYETGASSAKVTGSTRQEFTLYATYQVTVKLDFTMSGWADEDANPSDDVHSWIFTDSNNGRWTPSQLADELEGDDITVTVAADDSRAMIFSLVDKDGSVSVGAGNASPAGLNTKLPSSIPNDESESAAIAKFGVYVDGEGAASTSELPANVDSGDVSGNFEVTVE